MRNRLCRQSLKVTFQFSDVWPPFLNWETIGSAGCKALAEADGGLVRGRSVPF